MEKDVASLMGLSEGGTRRYGECLSWEPEVMLEDWTLRDLPWGSSLPSSQAWDSQSKCLMWNVVSGSEEKNLILSRPLPRASLSSISFPSHALLSPLLLQQAALLLSQDFNEAFAHQRAHLTLFPRAGSAIFNDGIWTKIHKEGQWFHLLKAKDNLTLQTPDI